MWDETPTHTLCEYSTTVSAPAFQAGDVSSILTTRSNWGYRIAAIAEDCKSFPSGSVVRVHLQAQHRVVEESGLSRFVWDEEHAGSNPAIPTMGLVETREYVMSIHPPLIGN